MKMDSKLLKGNQIAPGVWVAGIPAELTTTEPGAVVEVQICTHERLNDHEDACLDCGAVRVDGWWQ
jgi:hypothetical protein